MTEEQKEWGLTVNCKVIMNCDCDVILKESKCDLKKGQERYYCKMGKYPNHYASVVQYLPAMLYVQNSK